jgi:cyclic beta-1,2-glucan synthetase
LLAHSTGAFVALIFASSGRFAGLRLAVSRSAETEDRLSRLDATVKLRSIARRTWHYFETFVTPEHLSCRRTISRRRRARSSPPHLADQYRRLSAVGRFGARFRLDQPGRRVERIEATLSTIERMERYRAAISTTGTIRDAVAAHPLYVSSVDSGNLAGHLSPVAAACNEWAMAPSVICRAISTACSTPSACWRKRLPPLPDDRRQLRPLRQRLSDRIDGMRRAVEHRKERAGDGRDPHHQPRGPRRRIRKLARPIHHETSSDASARYWCDWGEYLEATCEAHVGDSHSDERGVEALRQR